MFRTVIKTIVILVLINFLGSKLYKRFDLTEDKRYTLSEAAKTLWKVWKKPS